MSGQLSLQIKNLSLILVIFRSEEEETVYRRVDSGYTEGHAELKVVEVRSLQLGNIYCLIPPHGDIHAVKTTSQTASVSIHILGNDTGCVLRHQFIPESHSVKSFLFGYSNAPCQEEEKQEHAQV